MLQKHSVIFEPSHSKYRITFTDSRETVWKVGIKLYWAFEPDNDKNNDFGDNNHDDSLRSLWTFCVLVVSLDLPSRISPDGILGAGIYFR